MICDVCKKNEATYHKVTDINGVVKEEHLCSKCAFKKGINKLDLFNFRDFFGNLIDDFSLDKEKLFCKNCLTSYEDFINSGLVGCSDCYDSFRKQITDMLSDVQFGTKHTGKRIEGKHEQTKEEKLADLQEQLKKAVAEERFEDAIVIKKQITELKEGK